MYPDSSRYLEGSLDDPPLYSLLIKIILSVFENLNCVIIFQSFLVGVSIIFFTRTISIEFNLNVMTKFIVALFLFLPFIQFYNNLLTEP